MSSSFTVTLHGVRGSLPTPHSPAYLACQGKEILEQFFDKGFSEKKDIQNFLNQLPPYFLSGWGGNTMCAEINAGSDNFIIDAGSGIRTPGTALCSGPAGKGKGVMHIFMTHLHWDHLLGLPFFKPVFINGNIIHMYAVQDELEEAVTLLFKRPCFPVAFKDLGAKILFHSLKPREAYRFGNTHITPYRLDHPDPCWGFLIEHGGKAYAHCVDTECKRNNAETIGEDAPLYTQASVVLFDAQYSLLESLDKVDWGHATAHKGMKLAADFQIPQIIFTHHDPFASDENIARAEREAAEYYKLLNKNAREFGSPPASFKWSFAREGTVIDI